MLEIISCLLSALVIAFALIPEIIKIANVHDYHDQPNERKLHKTKIPRFGGIAIFGGFIISALGWSFVKDQFVNIQYLAVALIMVAGIGFRDDFIALRPSVKLLVETLACILVMLLGDIRFTSLHGFLGIYEVHWFIGGLITLFTVIVITNAFNLIDGIDGLAGTTGLLVFLFFGVWFYANHDEVKAIIAFSLVGSIVGFLYYNYRTKIFMGDGGSLLLGFTAAVLMISFINQNAQLPTANALKFSSPVGLVSALLVFPLFDTLRVFIIRILSGRSPFSPDRNHIHHLLLNLGLSHLRSTAAIASCNVGFVVLATLLDGVSDNLLVPVVVLLAFLITSLLNNRNLRNATPITANQQAGSKPNSTQAPIKTVRKFEEKIVHNILEGETLKP